MRPVRTALDNSLGVAFVMSLVFGATAAAAPPSTQVEQTTPLHEAVHQKDAAKAAALVKAGADVNRVNRYGVTPLSLAAGNGDATITRLLLDAGADLRKADAALTDGRTVLMLAARTGSVEAMALLVAHGADVNAVERRMGTTALMWAAAEDRGAAVRALAEAGADVNARSKVTAYPHTPPGVIGDPLEEGYSYVGQTVLPRGRWTALMYAARQGSMNAARALADAGADLNAIDPDGTPALTFAIINGHYDIARLLAERGANVNVADRTGATPLYAAVDMHTLASSFGRPDLTPPVVDGSVDAVRMLLAHGADPNARLKGRVLKRVYNAGDPRLAEGATALMRAAKNADVTLMRLLIDAGADVNAVNVAGETAVHYAASSPAAIRLLAEHGAALEIATARGLTPLQTALSGREPNAEAVALLRELTGDFTTQQAAGESSKGNVQRAK